jgi:transcriptional regulator of heat shock response
VKKLTDRKQTILQAIIRDYLETAEPVGSRHISRKYKLDLSPATIRNEMADLEEEEYIRQPYTSAGRIPSDKGYRYYVDNIMRERPLTQKEEALIKKACRAKSQDIDFIAHQTLSAISSLTHYAAVMTVVEESGAGKVYHYGISNIVTQPEFSDISHVKQILNVFEKENFLNMILREYSSRNEVTIKIGSENRHKEIRDCSVVVSTYGEEAHEMGSIGLIGPTRMFYNKSTSIINYIAHELSELVCR